MFRCYKRLINKLLQRYIKGTKPKFETQSFKRRNGNNCVIMRQLTLGALISNEMKGLGALISDNKASKLGCPIATYNQIGCAIE